MSDQSDASSLSYLARLLRMAVTESGAPSNPVAGRIIVPLLGMAMAHGGHELIAEYVAPEPGEVATYEVQRHGPGDPEPAVLAGDLNAAAALRGAVRASRDGTGGIRVVGRSAAGVERCALNRTTDGVLEYVFPSLDAYAGPPGSVRAALRRWEETLGGWGADLDFPPSETPDSGIGASPPLSPPLPLSPTPPLPEGGLEQIRPLLLEISLGQKELISGISNQVGMVSRILGAVERLDLQVQELREQTRTSSGALQSLTEQFATLARRSEAAGERLAAAVGSELDELGKRVRHQLVSVEAAAKRSPDMIVPEAMGRLSSKLARQEAQLELLLKRLDDVVAPEPGAGRNDRLPPAAR